MVKLYKREGTYQDKNGETKRSCHFYLKLGNALIPVEVSYFENEKLGRDPQYPGRREIMKAFAEDLPTKDGTDIPANV